MRDNNRDDDVMCWNCFTVDNVDNDVEPITLKKVRIQQREKLKVYPFLASELSKPKAVALKQKLSSHYQIGKKNSEKIHKIKELHNDNFNVSQEHDEIEQDEKIIEENVQQPIESKSCQADNDYKYLEIGMKNSEKTQKIKDLHNNEKFARSQQNNSVQQDEKTLEEKYVQPLESQSCEADNDIECSQDNINESIKIKSNEFIVSDKTAAKQTKEASNDLINIEKLVSTTTATKKEVDHLKPTIIPVNQSVTCDETGPCHTESHKEGLITEKTSDTLNSTPSVIQTKGVGEDLEINVTKISVNKSMPSNTTDNQMRKYEAVQVLRQTTSPNTSEVSKTVTKVIEKSTVKDTPPKSPISRIPVKIERLTPESGRKILKSSNSIESPKTPETSSSSKDSKNVTIKNSSPKLGKIASDTNLKKKSESFLKYLGVSKKKYQEPIKAQRDSPSISLEDKIKSINFKMPTSETLSEVDETDGKEVVDKSSVTNSESGYAGSSATLRDLEANNDNSDKSLQLRTKSVEVLKPQQSEDTITVRRDEKVFTSLSSLSNIPKLSSLSKSSTITPIKKPVKSLRWSTLSMPARKFSFEDDIYISDTSTPHHGATLPRRSNSPLPHERDFDRERFPINRSGLQARSESMASVYSGAGEARGGVAVRGEVQFSLLYNYRLGALEVGVRGCRDLAPVDVKRNRSDPYVKVYLLPDKSKSGKRKTKVKKNTLSPVFDETLSFVQPLSSVSARTLWLSVWHADMFGRNDFLGEVRLPLADIVFDDPAPVWYKLHERTEQFDEQQGSRGDLIIGLKLELPDPRGKGTLRVLVKEAKNLVATKPNGLADVFCKSYLLPERGRLGKQKTGVCRRSLSPRWDHELAYRGVTCQQLASRALELSLWDRDRLASNDFMGAVRLSLGTGTYMGASVNWMDSVGKEVTLWQTMLDRPNFWVEGSLPLRPQLNN